MRIRRTLLLALSGAVVVACGPRDDADIDTEPGEDIAPAPSVEPRDMVVSTSQFETMDGAAGMQIFGNVELRRRGTGLDDDLELHVQLTGLGDQNRAWHIHRGTCASPGEIVIALSDAPNMDGIDGDLDPDDGRVEHTVGLDRDQLARLQPGESYIVNVHQGEGDNPGAPIACANLDIRDATLSTTPGTTPAPGTTPPAPPRN